MQRTPIPTAFTAMLGRHRKIPLATRGASRPSGRLLRGNDSRQKLLQRSVILVLAAASGTAWAQTEHYDLGNIVITAPAYESSPIGATPVRPATVDALRAATSDTASLLRDVPGVSLYGAGGVSSLPAIHGLADDRVRIQVDGMDLMPACPNHMNPALSYIDPTRVEDVKVYAGITPVSLGGDSIGGTIQVDSAKPTFARSGEGTLTNGAVGAFYRSNGNARGVDAKATIASEKLSVTYTGSSAQSDNYKAGADFKTTTDTGRSGHTLPLDEVGSTAYKAINQALDIALQSDNQLLNLKYLYQHIPYEGFPNQRMDMTGNENDQVDLGYNAQYRWGVLDAHIFSQATDHEMQFGDDKRYLYGTATGMPMNTSARNRGARIKATITLPDANMVRIGGEYQHYMLNDWWPPSGGNMAPNTFQNINDGQRDRYALFGEWELHFGPQWMGLLGVRHETVKMDTGDVHGYCVAGMCMGNQIVDSSNFNSQNRGKTDQNWDLAALTRYAPDATRTFEFGLARKTRSPNLYERYAWSTWSMAAIMNNFVGDGNGYVGNVDLRPEVAYTVSAMADWHDAANTRWGLKVTPYYTYVKNYIDAQCLPGTTCPADQFNVLQYVNQNAELYGVDISGHFPLARSRAYGHFTVTGLLSYVRGKNRSTGDNLYNIMPLNAKLVVVQKHGRWTNRVEAQFVAAKNDVSAVRNEIRTSGYGLLNLRSSYQWKRVRLDIGIENLFDRFYNPPLGGAYLGQGTTMRINSSNPSWGTAVPGMGRSVYASLNVRL